MTLFALLITAAAVPYALVGWEPAFGWLIQSVIHVGELLVVVALIRSGVAGPGRAARTGLGAAVLGQAALAGAEVIWPHYPDLGDALFGVGPMLTGVGLVVAGVQVLRQHRSADWRRFMPIAVGGYVFAVLMPVVIGSGGPPATAALLAIAGWDVLWALTAVAVLTRPATSSRSASVDAAGGLTFVP
jgi:hypothetical protein